MRSAIAASLVLLAGCERKAETPTVTATDPAGSLIDAQPLVAESAGPEKAASMADAEPAAVPPQHFQALGNEPFWSIEVLSGKLIYTSPDVQHGVVIASRFSGAGKRLEFSGTMQGKPVVLAIEPGTCSDGMSETVYPYNATFGWGGQTLQGCARTK